MLGFLKNNVLEDLCISRPAARLNWGIPLPFDPDFVTYVWFDALSNYITIPAAQGDPGVPSSLRPQPSTLNPQLALWPADIHLIGKDILKFHAVYWPIMLKAMGAPLPKQVLVHGWWQKDGQKMSKSTGNVVDPVAVIDEWGVDAFRFYVLRELDIGPDGNWTEAGFKARYSAELANGLGNLVNRSLSMLKRYRNGVVPSALERTAPDAEKVIAETRALLDQNRTPGRAPVNLVVGDRGPISTWTTPRRSSWPRTHPRPSAWTKSCITWRKSAGYSQCCCGLSCRERPARSTRSLAWPVRPTSFPRRVGAGLRPATPSARPPRCSRGRRR